MSFARCWTGLVASLGRAKAPPQYGPEAFTKTLADLRSRAWMRAKSAAVRFDSTYGRLDCAADLTADGKLFVSVDEWWPIIQAQKQCSPVVDQVLESYQETNKRMRQAEEALRPWVIRHLRVPDC